MWTLIPVGCVFYHHFKAECVGIKKCMYLQYQFLVMVINLSTAIDNSKALEVLFQ